eukprot:3569921-Pyramimonas_sp.AAC.1
MLTRSPPRGHALRCSSAAAIARERRWFQGGAGPRGRRGRGGPPVARPRARSSGGIGESGLRGPS